MSIGEIDEDGELVLRGRGRWRGGELEEEEADEEGDDELVFNQIVGVYWRWWVSFLVRGDGEVERGGSGPGGGGSGPGGSKHWEVDLGAVVIDFGGVVAAVKEVESVGLEGFSCRLQIGQGGGGGWCRLSYWWCR